MTNATIDNSISTDNVVLWQYDNATKFCAIVSLIENLGKNATKQFWDYFLENVDNIGSADDFGLAVWGIFIGVSRPLLTYSSATQTMTRDLYRKVLKARIKLMISSMTLKDLSQYAADIFGANTVEVVDNYDMSITYQLKSGVTISDPELAALYALSDYWQMFPAGVRDNGDPEAKFVTFKTQYQASTAAVQGTLAPNFYAANKGVYHPRPRSWSFYDTEGVLIETPAYSMSYVAGSGANDGTWTLSGGTATETQTGRAVGIWRDYGVYFPTAGVMALWS